MEEPGGERKVRMSGGRREVNEGREMEGGERRKRKRRRSRKKGRRRKGTWGEP